MKEFKINEIKELLKEKNLLEFNRDISQRHTNSILESVNQCGILRLPIIGDISEFDSFDSFDVIIDFINDAPRLFDILVGGSELSTILSIFIFTSDAI